MVSRNRVFPMEGEEKDHGDENELLGTQTVPDETANGLQPQSSDATVEFCSLTGSNSLLDQDHKVLTFSQQGENESRIRPTASPGGLMKRRNSNLANCEKMLQEMNDSISDEYRRKREQCEAILVFADEVNADNEGENRQRAQSVPGEEGIWNKEVENECDGQKKPEDPNQALLQYFAKLSSSVVVDDSLDLEHIQSLLHEGASANTSDPFGQTLLHEVSRTWGVDVAKFFIEQGRTTET